MNLLENYLLAHKIISTEHFYNGTPCWEFNGARNTYNYGSFRWGYLQVTAHRMAASIWLKEYNPKLQTLHHCDNPPCFNPEHLFQGSQAKNREDCANKRRTSNGNTNKTHCKRGHLLSDDNVYIVNTPYGIGRSCKKCVKLRDSNKC